MSRSPYSDLLKVTDADAALLDPDVARMRSLVTAMPAELCADDDRPAGLTPATDRLIRPAGEGR